MHLANNFKNLLWQWNRKQKSFKSLGKALLVFHESVARVKKDIDIGTLRESLRVGLVVFAFSSCLNFSSLIII